MAADSSNANGLVVPENKYDISAADVGDVKSTHAVTGDDCLVSLGDDDSSCLHNVAGETSDLHCRHHVESSRDDASLSDGNGFPYAADSALIDLGQSRSDDVEPYHSHEPS